jgi:hypothetical protein
MKAEVHLPELSAAGLIVAPSAPTGAAEYMTAAQGKSNEAVGGLNEGDVS